jgi:DNA-binding PadR family transcriptional regulator
MIYLLRRKELKVMKPKMHRMGSFFHGSHGRFFHHEPPMVTSFQKGDLKYVILSLIKDKPRYGYEVIKALEEKSHGFYAPSPGVVYPTLQMLEEMGYAGSTERDGKKVYTITEEGITFLVKNIDLADEVHKQMMHYWGTEKMEDMGRMMEEIMKLRELMISGLQNADSEKIERVRKVITKSYEDIEEILK